MFKLYTSQEQKIILDLIQAIQREETVYKKDIKWVFKSFLFYTNLFYNIAFKDYLSYISTEIKMQIVNMYFHNIKDYHDDLCNQSIEDIALELDALKEIKMGIDLGMTQRQYSNLDALYNLLGDIYFFQSTRIKYNKQVEEILHFRLQENTFQQNSISNNNLELRNSLILKKKKLIEAVSKSTPYPKEKIIS